jgi:hypothetical protein
MAMVCGMTVNADSPGTLKNTFADPQVRIENIHFLDKKSEQKL